MYNIDAIILKKIYIRDSRSIFSVFTKEYWKISLWIKESKNHYPVDIWNICHFVVKSWAKWNTAESYKSKNIISTQDLSFKSVESILVLIATMQKLIPENVPFETIYSDYSKIFPSLWIEEKSRKSSLLFWLKLLRLLWVAKQPDELASKEFRKLYLAVLDFDIGKLTSITWLEPEIFDEIENYNKITIANYVGL